MNRSALIFLLSLIMVCAGSVRMSAQDKDRDTTARKSAITRILDYLDREESRQQALELAKAMTEGTVEMAPHMKELTSIAADMTLALAGRPRSKDIDGYLDRIAEVMKGIEDTKVVSDAAASLTQMLQPVLTGDSKYVRKISNELNGYLVK